MLGSNQIIGLAAARAADENIDGLKYILKMDMVRFLFRIRRGSSAVEILQRSFISHYSAQTENYGLRKFRQYRFFGFYNIFSQIFSMIFGEYTILLRINAGRTKKDGLFCIKLRFPEAFKPTVFCHRHAENHQICSVKFRNFLRISKIK